MKASEVRAGQRVGQLTVLRLVRVPRGGTRPGTTLPGAVCACDCGGEVTTRAWSLSSRHTASCGCVAPKKARQFVQAGQRFGRGTVTVPGIRLPDGTRGARLECDCGNVYETAVKLLVNGGTVSCGCAKKEAATAQLRFRNRVLAGLPAAERAAYWARVRCSLAKEPEKAAQLLAEAAARPRLGSGSTPAAMAAEAARRRKKRAEARRARGSPTPAIAARWDRVAG